MKMEKNIPSRGKSEVANKNNEITPPPSIISFTGLSIVVLANELDLISGSRRVVREMSAVFERNDSNNLQKRKGISSRNIHRGIVSIMETARSRLVLIVNGRSATIRARLMDFVSSL